jgi:hypothetical protein
MLRGVTWKNWPRKGAKDAIASCELRILNSGFRLQTSDLSSVLSKNKRRSALTKSFYHLLWEFCKKNANIFSADAILGKGSPSSWPSPPAGTMQLKNGSAIVSISSSRPTRKRLPNNLFCSPADWPRFENDSLNGEQSVGSNAFGGTPKAAGKTPAFPQAKCIVPALGEGKAVARFLIGG